MSLSFVKPEHLSLKAHQQYNEKWVQKLIADDPAILGLGDLVLRDQERIQPRAGRLDLLLQDRETKRRYEVELQLSATDETSKQAQAVSVCALMCPPRCRRIRRSSWGGSCTSTNVP
ncbi:hypothetical protein ACOSOMT5_P3056 [Acidiphilium sp. MT5]